MPDRELRLYQVGKRLTAWDYPMALAHMHWQARAELDGRLDVYGIGEQSVETEIARREKLAAEKAAKEEQTRCPTP